MLQYLCVCVRTRPANFVSVQDQHFVFQLKKKNLHLFWYRTNTLRLNTRIVVVVPVEDQQFLFQYKINKIVVENNTTEEWLYICMEVREKQTQMESGSGHWI